MSLLGLNTFGFVFFTKNLFSNILVPSSPFNVLPLFSIIIADLLAVADGLLEEI